MKHVYLLLVILAGVEVLSAQNVGIGTNNPSEKLEVNGVAKTNGLVIAQGGSTYDVLTKVSVNGEIGFKKANGATAVNYIICVSGAWPYSAGATGPLIGEIRLFAGNSAPVGWMFCHGQLLAINTNTSLFSLLGTSYGGNGQTNFALPDLRGSAAVGAGASVAGYQWVLGEKSF